MSHPYHHAESSARKYGGVPEDYLDIHIWFDVSKAHMANYRHRALRHHALGIFEAEATFGVTITNSNGRKIPTRFIGEQHIREDCGGRIPSVQDWLRGIPGKSWMSVGDLRDDCSDHGVESLEAWRYAVSEGETTLGHADWVRRMQEIL